MIPKSTIEAFRQRKLKNSGIAKKYSDRKIKCLWDDLEKPKFRFEPFKHQKICFLLGVYYPTFFFMLDMGLGKTKISIDLFLYRKKHKQAKRMLVLVPSTSNVDAWRRELEIHAPKLRVGCMDSSVSGKERESLFFDQELDVLVCTYTGLYVIMCPKGGKKKVAKNSSKKKGKLVMNPKRIKACIDRFQMITYDESTFFKNHASLTFRVLRAIKAPYRYLLSGTPFSRDPMALWAQFFVCDRGETLGPTLGLFRETFFTYKKGFWSGTWELLKRQEKKLHRTLRHRAIRYDETECLDLPRQVGGIRKPVLRIARMSKDQYVAHEREFKALIQAHKEKTPLEAPYYKLRAISSGYIPCEGKQYIDFKENPKLDALTDLMEELAGKKVIIFFQYMHTADLIKAHLHKLKIKCVEISGRVSKKAEAIASFEKGTSVLLCNRAGAYGLNLQFCNRSIFFETPDGIAERKQSEKRTHRIGQTKTTYYYDIVMPGTVDDKIMKALKEGKRVLDVVIDGAIK